MSCEGLRPEVAISVHGVSKHYLLFGRPEDRLKQSIIPRLQRLAGRPPRQYFRDFAALHDVSFAVKRGETVGLIGRNGSGKSTLLQIICGTLRPSSGTVEVNGRIAALLELGAGFNPEFTGRENVYMNGVILGLSRSEIDARFEDIARFADIGEFIEQPIKTYSSGMYVRLAFAVAVCVDPDILVVDEALAVGDEAFQRKCFARIEQIQERGGTILFVSHAAQTMVQLCSSALLIDGGELIFEGRPKTVVSQYQRLVNASGAAAAVMRAEILRYGRDVEEIPIASGPVQANGSEPLAVGIEGVAEANGASLEGYDPNLVPQSTVYLEERGARIRDVRILTLKGDPVNILQMGRRYVFEFWVDFSVAASDIGFNMMVRTRLGLALAGAQTNMSRAHERTSVAKGSTVRVQFEFSCSFLPDAYFGTARAIGIVDGEVRVMHRIVDIIAFRVAPEPDLAATGQIDIGAIPRVQVTTSQAKGVAA